MVNAIRAENLANVAEALAHVNLSRSSYYDHLARQKRPAKDKYARRVQLVLEAAEACGQRYGYRKIYHQLRRWGYTLSEKIVRCIMKEHKLNPPAKVGTKFSSYGGENDHCPDNLLRVGTFEHATACGTDVSQYFRTHAQDRGLTHDFHADAPNMKWATDISEISCTDGKIYISPVIDLFDGYPIAVTINDAPNMKDLVIPMIKDAINTLEEGQRPIIHSDRGFHYRCNMWLDAITDPHHDPDRCSHCMAGQPCYDQYLLRPSLSQKGCSGDNAVVEGFFGTMKRELLYGRPKTKFFTKQQMTSYIRNYVAWYTSQRLNAARGYRTLDEYRADYYQEIAS